MNKFVVPILLILANFASVAYLVWAFFFNPSDMFSWIFIIVLAFLAGEALILEKVFPGEEA